MGSLTLNARNDLTYEEIWEGYANGKSRLPKIIKQIENGDLPLAETTGIDIKRRRTEGGNAENASLVGQTESDVVAKLISAARWDSLIAGYAGHDDFVTPPSFNMQSMNVRRVIKDTWDLLDEVAGVNFAEQATNSAKEVNALTGRQAKVNEFGSGARIREITANIPAGATADIDVRDYYSNDRIGLGGATGELHGVDQTITGVTVSSGSVDDVYAQTVIALSATGVVTVRYGTVQFGVIQIVGTTNGLTAPSASAYIVHPDFLEDLINFQ